MIKIGILGYGNLGKGVETVIKQYQDMQLVGIFTRRDPEIIRKETTNSVYHVDDILDFKEEIDVLVLCGGSYEDIFIQGYTYIKHFNTVDSFDNHKIIPDYFLQMYETAIENNKVSIVSVGWDPGLFSAMRILFDTILPNSTQYSFWGTGVSQGHSNAIRDINGVVDAIQYTVPNKKAIKKIRKGKTPTLDVYDKHKRICYVAIDRDYDKAAIEKEIKSIPDYFDGYNTIVNFVSLKKLRKKHSKLSHGGFVLNNGITGHNNKQLLEFNIKLDSNPEFTASILLAYARANYKSQQYKNYGAFTVLQIPLSYISSDNIKELVEKI